ncbi:3-isopropylmalate dehydratase small subunit [Caulobacter sp. 602-1]|uniref:3-isopropylmalate dehydratase small subunit n=1 Tax=unclassified Caulobacter TaxID=2648921 RepID=UPI000F6343C4|nr:3-isopropylmalate dehydratase small subunit [Caulobacter sp. 602-1]RRN66031.1 3-isopropylmalate dehydratase small subunit [Caulobacter sp. 602-1]
MEPFVSIASIAAPLPERDIDTDIIFPARYLLLTSKTGLGRYAFFERRYEADGKTEKADFPLNQPAFRGAQIIVSGSNFGCGSSREHAVWALADLGVRCVIADSFGDIFYSNCFKNGLLPVMVTPGQRADLTTRASAGESLDVDLEHQEIRTADGGVIAFRVDGWRREALLNGWDEIATISQTRGQSIAAFEDAQRRRSSWLYADE